MISSFDLIALLLTLAALFAWINRRFVRLPHSTGLLLLGLIASLLLRQLQTAGLGGEVYSRLQQALLQIDFTTVVMNGMLAFLIFAGALNVDLDALRSRAWPVAFLALIATIVSTILVGAAFYFVARAIGRPLVPGWCLVFGALISPTDPVAVLSTLKGVAIPNSLKVEMQGEALFNDGVGIVLFTLLLSLAAGNATEPVDPLIVFADFTQEAGGGLLLGVVTGYLGYLAMRSVDDYVTEVLITLAVVAASYAAAQRLGVSGPLAMVSAGLLIGDRAWRYAMSDRTQGYVTALWTLIDEVLNSILFLLIGLEVLVLQFEPQLTLLALAAIPIVLIARLISVSIPLLLFRFRVRLSARNVPFLTWAGVRGGISVALALSLPNVPARSVILAATYGVVLFAIAVQGPTLGIVVRHTLRRPADTGR